MSVHPIGAPALRETVASRAAARERVALAAGPAEDDADGVYWQELAEFTDWTRWVPPADDYRPDTTPDWRQI